MGKVLPSQRLLKQFEERLVFGEMNLSEIVRSGAQMMLQYALEREVTEALGRNYYENAPATTKEKGRRNGYESHRVLTGEGAVTVQVPQVRETCPEPSDPGPRTGKTRDFTMTIASSVCRMDIART